MKTVPFWVFLLKLDLIVELSARCVVKCLLILIEQDSSLYLLDVTTSQQLDVKASNFFQGSLEQSLI